MTRAQRKAQNIRRLIFVAGTVYALTAIAWIVVPPHDSVGLTGTPFGFFDNEMISACVFLAGLLFAQWAFLRPRHGWYVPLAGHGRPLKSAILSAAFMAMLLTVGLIALLMELPDWWDELGDSHIGLAVVWLGMIAVWAVWAAVFFVYWRQGDRYSQLGGMIRALVAGSLLETLVAVPVHVVVAQQRDCHCSRGSYTTLVFSGTVLLWAFGPGIFLLYAREKYRRASLIAVCPGCGAPVTGACERCATGSSNDPPAVSL